MKNVIVTGAGAGIGRETAKLFAAKGGRVVVADTDMPAAKETVEQIVGASVEPSQRRRRSRELLSGLGGARGGGLALSGTPALEETDGHHTGQQEGRGEQDQAGAHRPGGYGPSRFRPAVR